MTEPAARPFVATFYSYKGGVGRTTLAANTAAALAVHGKTLLWDLDIEAPGLHLIRDLRPSRPVKAGSFDRLLDWQIADCRPLTSRSLKAWDACVLPVERLASLHLLPAYADDKTLLRAYAQLDWARFFGREPDKGLDLIDALLAQWAEQGYEFVVIDSRTGITDLGALLAAAVPDITFLVGNFGRQNTLGLRLIWQALQAAVDDKLPGRSERGLAALQRRLVVSPMPQLDADRLSAAYQTWTEAFGLRPTEWLEIDEWPDLRFSESVLLISNPQLGPAPQYRQVAQAVLDARQAQREATRADAEQSRLYPELVRGTGHANGSASARGKAAQEQGQRFEDRVAHVLQLLRYSVQRETLVDSNRVDMIATLHSTLKDEAWMVECKDSQATKEMVEKLALWAGQPEAKSRQMSPMLVAQGFAPAALKSARDCNVSCFTLAQLEERLFNFKPYLAQLRAGFEQSPLAQAYVAQRVVAARREPADERADSEQPIPELLAQGVAWTQGQGKPLWLLLGDYGTGKTAFTQRLAYELAKHCETDAAAPAPVLINLRDYPNLTTLETVVEEHLAKTLSLRGSAGALLHLLHRGRCVLLLDSFDEMGLAAVGVSVDEQFRQLARPMVQPGQAGRMLITCREEFFRERKDAESAAAGVTDRLVRPGSVLEQAARAFDVHIDTLAYFDDDQVREYLAKHLGEREGERAFEQIRSVHGLADLATRPQLLEIVLDSLPELMQRGGKVNAGLLYFTYINRWLRRHRSTSSQLSQDALLQLLELLAQTLWARGAAPLHYTQLLAEVQRHQKLFPERDPVRVDLELRSNAFLLRSPDGLYRFSHRSFLEFFFARRLWRLAEARDAEGFGEALGAAPLRIEVVRFFADLWRSQGHEPCALTAEMLVVKQYPPTVATNLLRLGHWQGLEAAEDEMRVWARTLPAHGALLAGADLSLMNLSRVTLAGAVLNQANLTNARLVGANLSEASLLGASAADADFSDANCRGLVATGLDAPSSSWRGAKVVDARLSDANLRDSDWRGAVLSRSSFDGAQLDLAIFGAGHRRQLQGADVARCSLWHGEKPRKLSSVRSVPRWRLLPLGQIHSLAYSSKGEFLAAGCSDGSVCVFDAVTRRELRRLSAHQRAVSTVAWSPDQRRLVSGGEDGTARVWDTNSGQELHSIDLSSGKVCCVALSPDGKMLAIACEHGLFVWACSARRAPRPMKGHAAAVTCVAWAPGGELLASGSGDGSVFVWTVKTGSRFADFATGDRAIKGLAWIDESSGLIFGNADGVVWRGTLKPNQNLHVLIEGMGDYLESIVRSANEKLIAVSGSRGRVLLWDVTAGRCLRSIDTGWGPVSSLTWSPDGRWLSGGSWPETVTIWEASTGVALSRIAGNGQWIHSVSWSNDGRWLVSGGTDGVLRLWDAQSGRELRRFGDLPIWINSVAMSPDGKKAVGATNGVLYLWDVSIDGAVSAPLEKLIVSELRYAQGQKSISHVAWSADSSLVAWGDESGTVIVWNAVTGEKLHTLEGHARKVLRVAFLPDGIRLESVAADNSVHIWDLSDGRSMHQMKLDGNAQSFAWSADGALLAAGSRMGTVSVFDGQSGQALWSAESHHGEVVCLAWSADNQWLISGDVGGLVLIWQAATGTLHRDFSVRSPVRTIAWSSAGELAVGGSLLTCYQIAPDQLPKDGPLWLYQSRIIDAGPAVTLYPDGSHAGSGEALEWLEYEELPGKPADAMTQLPLLHRASDAPWLRRD